MVLDATDHYALCRQGRFLFAAFKQPHRVLSTCRVNGGLREDLTHIANHQSCEAVAHSDRHGSIMDMGLDAYHDFACAEAHLPPATTALMSTAANMQCAVVTHAAHMELAVQVVATAGVLGNATRAGDPAGWHKGPSGSVWVKRPVADTSPAEVGSGTIVTLVFINQPCTPACLVKAATMVTEGKGTAILDLRLPSLQSPGLATGTGTDQLAIAAPLEAVGAWARHWASSHNTLGELLGRATHDAVMRCLLLQNGLCAELRRTVCGALERGRFCRRPAGAADRTDSLWRRTGHRGVHGRDPDWPADLGGADLRRALRLVLVCGLLALTVGLALAPLREAMPW